MRDRLFNILVVSGVYIQKFAIWLIDIGTLLHLKYNTKTGQKIREIAKLITDSVKKETKSSKDTPPKKEKEKNSNSCNFFIKKDAGNA